jgi:hypothetical protein
LRNTLPAMLVLAHTGCRASEVGSTLGIASAAGIVLLRPWRRTRGRDRVGAVFAALLLATVITGGACSSSKTPARPTTNVRLLVEAPTPNQTTPPNPVVKLRVVGGEVVQRTTGKLTPTEGHIHLSVDGKLESMNYTAEHQLANLAPGPHTVEAEFVAVDHKPFKNRPRATVLFTVAAA